MKYFDSHAHYYDARFKDECEMGVDQLLDSLFASSVSHIVNVGTSPETSRLAILQARKFPNMYTAIGIHPTDGQYLSDPDLALGEIRDLLTDQTSKCVCLGEIGLDYHYEDTDRKKQMYLFEEQMTLAAQLGLPVVIHDRDAHADVMEVIRRHPQVHGILHSYSGSAEMVSELVRRNYMISFSGTVSFQNARRVKEAAAVTPPQFVLIETDAPYLAPHPLRGTLNHSGNLSYTNAALAEALGISPALCASLTEENAKRIFRL